MSASPVYSEGSLELPDGTTLAFTLSVPATAPPTNLALIAHPLGRLGGTKDDHVVRALAAVLKQAGWAVCTYDARGAGASTGSASFTRVHVPSDAEEESLMTIHA